VGLLSIVKGAVGGIVKGARALLDTLGKAVSDLAKKFSKNKPVSSPTEPCPAAPTPTKEAATKAPATPPADDFGKKAAQFIAGYEGYSATAYYDTLGYRTVAVGFNMDRAGAREDFQKALPGVNFDDVYKGTAALANALQQQLLEPDVQSAIGNAKANVPSFDRQPEAVQLILTDMAYNMKGGLDGWPGFCKAIDAGAYAIAAEMIVGTPYADQTLTRAQDHIDTLGNLGTK